MKKFEFQELTEEEDTIFNRFQGREELFFQRHFNYRFSYDTDNLTKVKIENFKSLSALSFIAVVTIYPVLTLPAMIGLLMDHAEMTSFSAGWVVAIGTFSTATAGFLMSTRIDRHNIKQLSRVTLVIAILMDLISAFTANMIIIIFLVRILWGLAMGVAHASSISSIAHYENFKDGYGLYVGLQFIVSGLGLYLVPVYSELIGVEGFFIAFVIMDLIALYLTKFLHNKSEIIDICKLIGSDVILGLNSKNCILTSQNLIRYFPDSKKFYILIVKPNYGCDTKIIYSKVKRFNKPKLSNPNKKMFNSNFLKKTNNHLENVAFSKYSKLKSIKLYLESLSQPAFVRMTGSGSAIVAYYKSKERCENAKKEFNKKYKNYWCIASKTI